MSITVIIPSAGSGSRLGLSYPKELYEIFPGIKLIDFSLMHIKKYLEKSKTHQLKIAVVIKKGKESVFNYVSNKFPEIPVYQVLFNEKYFEWAGSVFSAEKYFSEKNIVLLPDSFIELSKDDFFGDGGLTLIEKMSKILEKSSALFTSVPCLDKNKLSKLGALYLKNEKIINFQDKPVDNFDKYNAFWCAYGFKAEIGRLLYDFLTKSIKHEFSEYKKEAFYPAAGTEVSGYHDLGTPKNIEIFKNEYSLKLSSVF